jgi:hypothetical protein
MKNITPKPQASEEAIKLIDELNEKSQTDKGQWLWTEELGIVWQPITSPMPSNDVTRDYQLPTEPTPPPLIESLVKWGKTIDFDNLPQNAVIIIKLSVQDPLRVQMMQRAIARQVLEPRAEKLKANKACVLFMQSDDDISIMTEQDMNKAGWEKKDKKLIITLDA